MGVVSMARDIRSGNPIKIAPSILSANFGIIKEQMALLEHGGADWVHIDVMDGNFVPNITLGPVVISHLREFSTLPFDVHLMIQHPEFYIKEFADAGADLITVHAEATLHLQRTLSVIKDYGLYAGVSVNPSTPLNVIEWVLDDVDVVLIMTVNPGFGGQRFIPQILDKIKKCSEMLGNRDIILEVDGGIKDTNIYDVVKNGATAIVAGSFTFKANNGDIEGNIARLRERIKEALEGQ